MQSQEGVRADGPLEPFRDGVAEALSARGYSKDRAAQLMRLMAHLSRWLESRGLGPGDLSSGGGRGLLWRVSLTSQLVQVVQVAGPYACVPALGWSRSCGRRLPVGAGSRGSACRRLSRLSQGSARAERGDGRGLRQICGRLHRCVVARRADRRRRAGRQRCHLAGPHGEGSAAPCFAQVHGHRPSRTAALFHARGLMSGSLVEAVPAMATWPRTARPSTVTSEAAARLVGSCDSSTAIGRRDTAI